MLSQYHGKAALNIMQDLSSGVDFTVTYFPLTEEGDIWGFDLKSTFDFAYSVLG